MPFDDSFRSQTVGSPLPALTLEEGQRLYEKWRDHMQVTTDWCSVHRTTIEICEGDCFIAAVLQRILYWHSPSQKTGAATRMRPSQSQDSDRQWMGKSWTDFRKETGIRSRKTIARALGWLEARGIIETRLKVFASRNTVHMALNWGPYLTAFDNFVDATKVRKSRKNR